MSDVMCDKTVEYLQQVNWKPEIFYVPYDNVYKPPGMSLDVSEDTIPNHDEIMKLVWDSISTYIFKDLNVPWFNSWNGFTGAKYNRYSQTHGMDLHCDHIQSIFDGQKKGVPILTILIILNNDFEGGEFIMFDEEVIPFSKGDVLIFPSNFLFPHKVNAVTAGVRYSTVFWAW
jgi:hypothetical protein